MRKKMTLRVVHLRRLLDLSSVREVPGVSPRTIEITGNRMDLTTRVEVNGVDMPDFAAVDPDRLIVTLPARMRSRVQSVAVLSNALDPGGSSKAYYDLGLRPVVTEGKYRVLQRFIKKLLTSPGSNVWNKSDGGGLRQLMVTNIDPRNASAISGEVSSKVMQSAKQLVLAQARDHTVPMAERVLGATVNGVQFSLATQSLQLRVSLEFQDGKFLAADVGWAA
ncbi:MAG: hypothetical protein KKC80_08820 [Candidatus Margulisbacteria bacterium]|nr:hypothetical protein [Candidatus Margulisiibacteriota bacterium]